MPLSPGQTTLGDVRDLAQTMADMEENDTVSDETWDKYIGLAYYKLYNELVTAYGNDYYVADPPYDFTTDGTSDKFDLPDDFLKLLGVSVCISAAQSGPNARWMTLKPFNFAERDACPQGVPAGGQLVRVQYVPRLTLPTDDDTVIDGISGFEEYLAIDAAIKAKASQDLDVSTLKEERAIIEAKIQNIAENRDAGSPGTVVDVTSNNGPFGYGGYGFYGGETNGMRYRLNGSKLWLQPYPIEGGW